jgi:hypothetical protein
MANRFPLIVNNVTKRIEEITSGDNIDLTGNNIIANGSAGTDGKYLKSNGETVVWDNPGDVYLTATQTLSNKTFIGCNISGSSNIITNIPNSSLLNSSITINGSSVSLGGSVTIPDNNSTYAISAIDGNAGSKKGIRLTGTNPSTTDEVFFVAGSNVTLSRVDDEITISSSYVDTNTVTRLSSAVGGSFVSGDVVIAAGGSSTVSQSGNTITISSSYIDTVTRLRGTSSGTYLSGDFTLVPAGATTITQVDRDITISSQDTITRLRGGLTGTLTTGDVTVTGSGATTVSQSGSTITVSSTDTNTVTRVRGTVSGTYESGDITIVASGAATVSQSGTTITVSATDTNTTYTADANGGLSLTGTIFSLKNGVNLQAARIPKWDGSNKQFTNSIISDDGSTVTIGGDLIVSGVTTTIDTTTLIVSDNEIELRKGNSLVGSDGGIRLNRTTNSSGVVQSYTSLQWFESGGFWRVFDGSIARRLVTETESQTLTNKTLTSPILTNPQLGIATATSINGLTITNSSSGILTIANAKTLQANNSVTFSGTDGSVVSYGNGGTVAYREDNLSVFAATSSAQLRGVISDETGTGVAVFNTNPSFVNSIVTGSTTFSLINTGANTVNAFGSASTITFGASTGSTTIAHDLVVNGNVTLNDASNDTVTLNGIVNVENNDLRIRGSSLYPMSIGRGGAANEFNTRVGYNALQNNSTGSQNTAFGFEAALTVNSGASNTAIGYRALRNTDIGDFNIAVGRDALLNNLSGNDNVAVGVNALSENEIGNNNVCIGTYAGYACLGSGNVLIGPATDKNASNVTYVPPLETGDRQLVIGSGTGAWIRGNSAFDVTIPQNLGVAGNLEVTGNLTVNGVYTSVNSSIVTIDDKTLELGAVVNTTFEATVTNNTNYITGITPTTGLIPGMVVNITTGGISVPAGTTIVSIFENTATLSENVVGSSGTATFNAVGPSDTSAAGGGIILKGTTDKTITWNATTNAWVSTENFDLATAKEYRIGNNLAVSTTTLGSTVVNSSLTSVGTLTGLTVEGPVHLGGRISEKVTNSYSTALTPSLNVLTVDCNNSSVVVGTTAASAINTWNFTNVNLTNGKALTLTLIIDSNTSATYGDACAVDGTSISGGIRWAGGSPPSPSPNEDILTFVIVKDVGGTTRVYGSGNTGFS